jgi:hypothetical protein
VLREQGIVTVHDQVVSLVAQRWAKAFHCKVTIHTGLEQDPWADPQQQCDIVGWQVSSAGSTMEWMAEVETDDSIRMSQPFQNGRRRWGAGSHSICSCHAVSRSRHRSWQGTPLSP